MESIFFSKLNKEEHIENNEFKRFENDILNTEALKHIKGGGGENDDCEEDAIIYI